MKFLADENIGLETILRLRQLGFDVVGIVEKGKGIGDTAVLIQAISQKRMLITTDKDFGFLVFQKRILPEGLILLRLKQESFAKILKVLTEFLISYKDKLSELRGKFFVLSETRVRFRKIRQI